MNQPGLIHIFRKRERSRLVDFAKFAYAFLDKRILKKELMLIFRLIKVNYGI